MSAGLRGGCMAGAALMQRAAERGGNSPEKGHFSKVSVEFSKFSFALTTKAGEE
jgi:hypothetical protein